MKARRGDLSGPVLAILVTLVLLAIGAAMIAYFVLLGTAPQQAVIAVVGQPTIVKAGANGFIANVTIKNVGSTNITLSTGNIRLNITGTLLTANFLSRTSLTPGATATIGFSTTSGWGSIAARETVSGSSDNKGCWDYGGSVQGNQALLNQPRKPVHLNHLFSPLFSPLT